VPLQHESPERLTWPSKGATNRLAAHQLDASLGIILTTGYRFSPQLHRTRPMRRGDRNSGQAHRSLYCLPLGLDAKVYHPAAGKSI
jgi:hypothetical protein